MNKILRTSAAFSLLFKCLIFLYPIYVIAAWCDMLPSGPDYQFSWAFLEEINLSHVSMHLRLYACLINSIHTAIVIFSFYYLYKLFQLYAKGIIFSKQNINYLQKIGSTFLLQTIVWILEQPLLEYVLTLESTPRQHLIRIVFDAHDLSNLIIGSIVILISWIMNEAKKNEDELALTV